MISEAFDLVNSTVGYCQVSLERIRIELEQMDVFLHALAILQRAKSQ